MPYNFSWIEKDQLAGMARPRREDGAWLREQGITVVISLTERAADLDEIEVCSIPVRDMTAPSLDQMHAAVEYIAKAIQDGGAVAVHCAAGMGRTGTILAAYLIAKGATARDAVRMIRQQRPGSIETRDQMDALTQYAELVGGTS